MRSLPTSNDGNPHSQNFPDTPLKDVGNPQESEMHRICTNKAFSVSLATLSECTIEQSGGSFDRASCIHSVISVIPSQEIQKMTEEIKALDEETLKPQWSLGFVVTDCPGIQNGRKRGRPGSIQQRANGPIFSKQVVQHPGPILFTSHVVPTQARSDRSRDQKKSMKSKPSGVK
ncbi:hypothetical protein ATANTOWER_024144 [Ataeniobius toweri]|uniref:Uncharacterized protein n=1 Tax=Ataeniobius toweri TaxID=208326 RepID=A0ABU7CLI5_9TELE|nr:hypothetical protein [Ataeniobius toweri]